MRKVLEKEFFARDVVKVARDLIGKYLVIRIKGKEHALMITETEAYDGEKDLANHASKGRTKRTEVLYAEPGTLYVYLCYGMYYMLNVVTNEREYPAAVLIRGAGQYEGPGKLTKALGITKAFQGLQIGKDAGLWFEDRGAAISKRSVGRAPRVGIESSGPVWSRKPYRFLLKQKIASGDFKLS